MVDQERQNWQRKAMYPSGLVNPEGGSGATVLLAIGIALDTRWKHLIATKCCMKRNKSLQTSCRLVFGLILQLPHVQVCIIQFNIVPVHVFDFTCSPVHFTCSPVHFTCSFFHMFTCTPAHPLVSDLFTFYLFIFKADYFSPVESIYEHVYI